MTDDYEDYSDIIKGYCEDAFSLSNHGKLKKGVERCNEGIRFAQEHGILHGNYKRQLYSASYTCHKRLEDTDAALNDIMILIELDASALNRNDADQIAPRAHMYWCRAHLYLKKGNYQACITDCTTAIALHPQRVDYYILRSQALCRLGRKQEAIEDINHTLTLDDRLGWNARNAPKILEQIEAGTW
jgi:tetratricopeptide (TPR) repeat protein